MMDPARMKEKWCAREMEKLSGCVIKVSKAHMPGCESENVG